MMKDKVVDALVKDAHNAEAVMATINGLVLAQIICRRHTLNAFDENCQKTVLDIMEEIVETIEHLREEYLDNVGQRESS